MRRIIRLAAATASLLLVLGTATVGFASSANADPIPPRPCYGSDCNGQPVGACGNSDYYNPVWTSAEFYDGATSVWLYYSPWCNANWAYAQNDWPGMVVVDSVWVHNSYGAYGWGSWGQMVDGSVAAQACIRWHYYADPNTYDNCTNWY